jgi:hypothetical protein
MIVGATVRIIEIEESNLLGAYKGTKMGDLKTYLGMDWVRDRKNRRSWLNQETYCMKILKRFEMENSASNETPLAVNYQNNLNIENDEEYDIKHYQEAVGSLIYLTTGTRPDIAYAVSVVSRSMAKPYQSHWKLIKGIFRYLKGTSHFGIEFGGKDELTGFSDADWAMDAITRRSTTGFIYFLGGPISWKSTLQKTVALSSTEAEFMALVSEIQEGLWLVSLLTELGLKVETPVVLHEDNQGCIALANNPSQHGRSKHIDIKYFFIREKIAEKSFVLKYCDTEHMIADVLTKALPVKRFKMLRDKLGVVDIRSRRVLEVGGSKAMRSEE